MEDLSLDQKKAAIRKHEADRKRRLQKQGGREEYRRRQVARFIEAFRAFPYLGGRRRTSLLSKLKEIGVESDGIDRIAMALTMAKDSEKARTKARQKYGTARAALSRRATRKPSTNYLEIGFKKITTREDYKATDAGILNCVTLTVWGEVRKASQRNFWGLVGQLLEVAGFTKSGKPNEDRVRHFRRLEDRTRRRVTRILTA